MKSELPPNARILVDAVAAAELCNVSRSTWLGWDAAGLCPRSIHIKGRVLWSRQVIEQWALNGCPNRELLSQAAEGVAAQKA